MFAWLVEGMAVAMGLLLAVYAGIEGSDGGFFTIFVASLPFLALSVVELTKIPLVGLIFAVGNFGLRVLAVLALLLVTTATFENFVFGFERSFNERIRGVELAEQAVRAEEGALRIAQGRVADLTARQSDLAARLAVLREETAAVRQQAQDDIADSRRADPSGDARAERERLDRDLSVLEQRRLDALARERRNCPTAAQPDARCNVPAVERSFAGQRGDLQNRIRRVSDEARDRSRTLEGGVLAARRRRDAEIEGKEAERAAAQAELNAVRGSLAQAQAGVLAAEGRRAELQQVHAALVDRSQLHRLALVLHGSHERAELEDTKKVFVVSLAAIIAVVGTVLATLYHAAGAPARRPVLSRALRGWLARSRRRTPLGGGPGGMGAASHASASNRTSSGGQHGSEPPVTERVKLVFLPEAATEADIAAARSRALSTEAAR